MFLSRLSSEMDIASSVPSGSCAVGAVVGDAAGERVRELALCGAVCGGSGIGGFVG